MTTSKSHPFPLDLPGVARIGLDEWMSDYALPLTGYDYQDVYQSVRKAFIHALREAGKDSPAYWIGVANYKMVVSLAKLVFKQRSLRKLAENGTERVLVNGEEKPVAAILAATENDLIRPEEFQNTAGDLIRETWRVFRTNWSNGQWPRAVAKHACPSGDAFVGDPSMPQASLYLKSQSLNPPLLRPLLFSVPRKHPPAGERDHVLGFADVFVNGLRDAFADLDEAIFEQIRERMARHYSNCLAVLHSMTLRLANPGTLYFTQMGNLNHRLLAAAWLRRGGETVGFSHGNNYPFAYPPGDVVNGSRLVLTTYVAASAGEAKQQRDCVRDFANGLESTADIVACSESIYKSVFERLQSLPDPRESKRVMLIGYAFDYSYSVNYPAMNTLTMFRLEMEVARALRKHGFEVVYKAHPETCDQVGDLVKREMSDVDVRPFEHVLETADVSALIFVSPFTTTFGHALMSKLPIVLLFDRETPYWHPELRPLLEKRCAYPHAKASREDGFVRFDPKELVDAIDESKNRLDFDIVHEFAL